MFKRLRNIFGRPVEEDQSPQETIIEDQYIDDEDDEADTLEADQLEAALADEELSPAEIAADNEAYAEEAELEAAFADITDMDEVLSQTETAALVTAAPEVDAEEDDTEFDEDDTEINNPEAIEAPRAGFNPFRLGLQRTRGLFSRVNTAFAADEITDDIWDELEESMIAADVGVQLTEKLLSTLRDRVRFEKMVRGSEVREALKEELQLLLGETEPLVFSDSSPITVILVVGINGVGKTTSIAKMTNMLTRDKHRVIIAAGDTFRAAAIEQIKTWGERLNVPVISHQHGSDPAAVVFDAMEAAQARKADVLLVDTAGRLHTKSNLMEELKKMGKILARYDPEAPHEVLLVLDATTGQNAILQAKTFVQDAGVSGIILTKLDGTARGGVVFSISSELGLPIKFIGTGEKVTDISPFDPTSFVDALFEE